MDYREEIKLIVKNNGKKSLIFKKGDRIAQGVIVPIIQANFILVETLTETDRKGGFGSTGV